MTGFEFQQFIVKLNIEKYGETDFVPLREVKDKGCDGIIESEKTIIACYGPKKYVKQEFETKIKADFSAYRTNWEAGYPKWRVYVNHEVTPDEVNIVGRLKPDAEVRGIAIIMNMIETLPGFKRRKLGSYLKIDNDFFTQDYLGELLENLLRSSEIVMDNISYPKSAPDLLEKFRSNYSEEDLEGAIKEYDVVEEYFQKIAYLLYGYEDEEIDKLKHKVIKEFYEYAGSFKERCELLTGRYLTKYSNDADSDYLFYIRALLLYLFSQCLIGKAVTELK